MNYYLSIFLVIEQWFSEMSVFRVVVLETGGIQPESTGYNVVERSENSLMSSPVHFLNNSFKFLQGPYNLS